MEQLLVNRYKVVNKLGEGGMGTVYQVQDLFAGEQVLAFKILSGQIADSQEALLQFKQEFRLMNKLKHPNTVNVFDYGVLPDRAPYLTMELVPGKELSELKNLDYPQITKILSQLCQALSFIHSRLLVHCDIKPQNIRIKSDGTLKLMDFGLMNQLGLRSNGQIFGTVDYLPPEIPTGGIINASSDLYSVGIVAYELISGKLPFTGNSILEVIRAQINNPAPDLLSLFPDLPPKLGEIVAKLLQKKTADRYQSAAEVIADLAQITGIEPEIESFEQKKSYLNSSVLVGRDQELKMMLTALEQVENGHSRSLFVCAPAGVGKSRLIQEFKLQVQLSGHHFASGLCFEQGMSAYKPVADSLRQFIPLTTKEELQKYGAVLVKILPELREKGFIPLDPLAGISEKLRLFDTVTAWLRDLSSRNLLVVFIEDLHWTDQASIDLLNTCIRDLRKAKIFFTGTFRDDEAPQGHPLWQTVEEDLSLLIRLEAFSVKDIGNLIEAMFGSIELKTDFVNHIRNATGGNAFFISEVMRYLVEEEIVRLKLGKWFLPEEYTSWELPTSIEATVVRRINTLSDRSRDLVRLAAVAGRKLNLALFKAVSDLEEEEIFLAIDELIERQFLNRLGNEYLFPHDRVRETLYESLDPAERKKLHQRVAETIETENIDRLASVSGELAYHFSRGSDLRKAIKYLLSAGFASPVRMDSSQLLKQAFDFLESEKEIIPDSWLDTFLFEIVGKNEESLRLLKEENSQITKNFVLEILLKKIAWISYMIAPKICLEASEKLIFLLKEQGKGAEVTAEFESIRASSYTMIGRNDTALEITDPVIAEQKHLGTMLRGLMLFGRLNALLTTGRFRQLVKDMEETTEIFEKNLSSLSAPLLWAYGFSSFIREDAVAWLGEKIGNNRYENTVREIAGKYNHLDLDFWSYYPEVVRNSLIGNYDKIKAVQEKLLNMVKRMGRPIQHENRFNVCLAFAAIQNGQLLEAKAMTKKIVELAKRLGNPHQQASGFILEGMIFLAENKAHEAVDFFQQAVNLSQNEEGKLKNDQLIPALYRLSEAFLANHQINEAEKFLEQAHKMANTNDFENPYHLCNTFRLSGRIYSEKKDYESAHDYLLKSLTLAKENELFIQEAFTQISIGELWFEMKKYDLTRVSWQKAISIFREINNEYQANKILTRLNSVPQTIIKPRKVIIESNKNEVQSKEVPTQNLEKEKAAEIGYKLLDLFSALGLATGSRDQKADFPEELSAENRILAEKLKRVEVLNDFGQMLLSSLELDQVLNNIIAKVIEVSEADRGFLLLLNDKGDLHSRVVRTKEGSVGENMILNFSKTFTDEVLKTGKPLWVADAQADSRFSTQRSVLAMDLRTVLCVPLKEKDKVIGLIYVDRKSVIKSFSEEDLTLVESISVFASVAIVNARLHQQATERNEKLQILNDLSRTISSAFTREELLKKMLGFAIRITGAEIGYVLTGEERKCELSLDREGNTDLEVNLSSSIVNKVAETGKSLSVVDTSEDQNISTQASIIALDIRSVMCVPLASNNRLLGVVYVSSRTLVKSFTARDLSLLEDIVGQTALAIDNLSLLEVERKQDQLKKELDIARKIQKSMLPAGDPTLERLEVAGFSQSATEVGGDYYDYLHLDENRFALAFGDVTGHGVSAGLLMAMAKSCMFVQCQQDPEVIPVMTALNKMICGSKTEKRLRMGFVYSIFDLPNSTLTISAAGHPLPYHYRQKIGDLEPIRLIAGYQLGVKESTKFRETIVELSENDLLVYFTDGIVEARNSEQEEYGYERLEELIRNNCSLSAIELREIILREYQNWAGENSEMEDDITVVVIRVKESE